MKTQPRIQLRWKHLESIKYLAGWWLGHPSEKYERQLGWLFPIYGKIKHVPNHQPVLAVSLLLRSDVSIAAFFSRRRRLAQTLWERPSSIGFAFLPGTIPTFWSKKTSEFNLFRKNGQNHWFHKYQRKSPFRPSSLEPWIKPSQAMKTQLRTWVYVQTRSKLLNLIKPWLPWNWPLVLRMFFHTMTCHSTQSDPLGDAFRSSNSPSGLTLRTRRNCQSAHSNHQSSPLRQNSRGTCAAESAWHRWQLRQLSGCQSTWTCGLSFFHVFNVSVYLQQILFFGM